MKTLVIVLGLAISLFGSTALQAQSTNKPAASKKTDQKDGTHKSAHPFHGKLAAVDKTAKTITVGKSVYQITSETKIQKNGNPATLDDGAVGEEASGYVKPMEGGKMYASSLTFGPKVDSKGATKKKQ
jgi:hypothetical protein